MIRTEFAYYYIGLAWYKVYRDSTLLGIFDEYTVKEDFSN